MNGMERRALIHVFIILGTVIISLILWRIFVGTDVNMSNYTNKGALFEEFWYTGSIDITDGRTGGLEDISAQADRRPGTLRRVMQDNWVTNSDFNGLESQIVCGAVWTDMADSSLTKDNAKLISGITSPNGTEKVVFWTAPSIIDAPAVTLNPVTVRPGNTGIMWNYDGGSTGGGGGGGSGDNPHVDDPDNPTPPPVDERKNGEIFSKGGGYYIHVDGADYPLPPMVDPSAYPLSEYGITWDVVIKNGMVWEFYTI